MSNQQAAGLLIAPIKVWASIKQCYVVGLGLFFKLGFGFVHGGVVKTVCFGGKKPVIEKRDFSNRKTGLFTCVQSFGRICF